MASNSRVSRRKIKEDWQYSSLEIQISYNAANICPIAFKSPLLAYQYFLIHWDMGLIDMQEQVMVIFLNHGLKLIGHRVIGTGTSRSALIYRQLIAGIAINCLASCVIVAHNHPSGNLQPSTEDFKSMALLKKTLAIVETKLLDSLIITRGGYKSMMGDYH